MTKNQDIFMTLVILLNNNDINKFKEMIYKHSEYDFSYKDNTYQDTILHNIFLHKNFNKEYLDLLIEIDKIKKINFKIENMFFQTPIDYLINNKNFNNEMFFSFKKIFYRDYNINHLLTLLSSKNLTNEIVIDLYNNGTDFNYEFKKAPISKFPLGLKNEEIDIYIKEQCDIYNKKRMSISSFFKSVNPNKYSFFKELISD